MPGDLERHNQQAIDALNQRGGRMLSLVDLLAAGTVGLEMAAEMVYVAAGGGSFLTAAGPGGVGKTTLMGAVLAFLPPGTEIVTIEGPRTLARLAERPAEHPECLVVHEIGSGPHYGYLWGRDVGRYFALGTTAGRCVATNLHAESYDEAASQLTAPRLDVSAEALRWVDLLAFMAARRGRRRVTTVWYGAERLGAPHQLAWRWCGAGDRFERAGPEASGLFARHRGIAVAEVDARLRRYRGFLEQARRDGCNRMEDLRRRALAEVFDR